MNIKVMTNQNYLYNFFTCLDIYFYIFIFNNFHFSLKLIRELLNLTSNKCYGVYFFVNSNGSSIKVLDYLYSSFK
jgi:hypothetical protein